MSSGQRVLFSLSWFLVYLLSRGWDGGMYILSILIDCAFLFKFQFLSPFCLRIVVLVFQDFFSCSVLNWQHFLHHHPLPPS